MKKALEDQVTDVINSFKSLLDSFGIAIPQNTKCNYRFFNDKSFYKSILYYSETQRVIKDICIDYSLVDSIATGSTYAASKLKVSNGKQFTVKGYFMHINMYMTKG